MHMMITERTRPSHIMALVLAASTGFGLISISMAQDFGIRLKLDILLDASAAIGIGSRAALSRELEEPLLSKKA
eukprot:3323473-Amphidinium_carterae.1